jgi:hypothetical protein
MKNIGFTSKVTATNGRLLANFSHGGFRKQLLEVRGLATQWQVRLLMYSSERFNLATRGGHAALVVFGAWRNGQADDAGATDEVRNV